MQTKLNKPKGFGEILDLSFSLSKARFKDFFIILLIMTGPVYLLQAILQIFSGTSFLREVGVGTVWYEQILASFEGTETFETTNLAADLGMLAIGLLGLLLFPIAEGAILFALNHIRKNEEFTVGSVIKLAFSRFWAMFGSNLLFGLIVFGFTLIVILALVFGFMGGPMINPVMGILGGILLFILFAIGAGFLLTRWSFYFASVVLEKNSPGFSRSWQLTRKRTWTLIGLYIIFYLIITIMSSVVEATFGIVLGNSVLLSIITNLMTIVTTLVFSVGYGVMYFDLLARTNAEDLKDLIEEYN